MGWLFNPFTRKFKFSAAYSPSSIISGVAAAVMPFSALYDPKGIFNPSTYEAKIPFDSECTITCMLPIYTNTAGSNNCFLSIYKNGAPQALSYGTVTIANTLELSVTWTDKYLKDDIVTIRVWDSVGVSATIGTVVGANVQYSIVGESI